MGGGWLERELFDIKRAVPSKTAFKLLFLRKNSRIAPLMRTVVVARAFVNTSLLLTACKVGSKELSSPRPGRQVIEKRQHIFGTPPGVSSANEERRSTLGEYFSERSARPAHSLAGLVE